MDYEKIIGNKPYKIKYAKKYGIKSLASSMFDLIGRYSEEEMYKIALEKGITWEEVVNHKKGVIK